MSKDALQASPNTGAAQAAPQESPVRKEVVTRAALAEYLHARHPTVTRVAARAIINDLVEAMAKALSNGHDVHLKGFGRFEKVRRRARSFIVPATGERGSVPDRHSVRLIPSKSLKWD